MKRHNISIQIGIGFFAALALAIYYEGGAMEFIAAAAVHELGHISAMALSGETDIRIELKAFGIYIINHKPSFSIKREAAILLFGPISGILAAAAARNRFEDFADISTWLSMINLLPLKGTDGGGILKLIYPGCFEGGRKLLLAAVALLFTLLLSVFVCGKTDAAAAVVILLIYLRGELCDERYI